MIKLNKGLELPITGAPDQSICDQKPVSKVALIGDDLAGMKPTMEVKVGDKVKKGQLLFTDKKTEGVRYTAPASGEVIEVNRGARRAFQSVVIKIEGDESVSFSSYKSSNVADYDKASLKELLIESGFWPSFRRRPFSKVANPSEEAKAIFVTAMDTHPLSADPTVVITNHQDTFQKGLKALSLLNDKVYLCKKYGATLPGEDLAGVKTHAFSGPHPAGLAGTHIHYLDPVGEKSCVWHIGYQDVIALGKLIDTGALYTSRVISLAGPAASKPRLIETQLGACLEELVKDEVSISDPARVISGSVFGGRNAKGAFAYLGRFHNQVSLLREGTDREFLGWHSPGLNKFSVKPIYLSKLFSKKFAFDTNTNGSHRSLVPIGSYEKVMPLDIQPTFLLRTLMAKNTENAVALGALELDEEDLSLCTFVDPSKNDFGPVLRENLTQIEKEG